MPIRAVVQFLAFIFKNAVNYNGTVTMLFQSPVVVLEVMVVEAKELEAKDADGQYDKQIDKQIIT